MDINQDSVTIIAERILGCAFTVSSTLGAGFLDGVYENALAYELRKAGLTVVQQHATAVLYHGVTVGVYTCDILVEGTVMVEVKAIRSLDMAHNAQCRNYLKATGLRFCLLLNFGNARLQVRRVTSGA